MKWPVDGMYSCILFLIYRAYMGPLLEAVKTKHGDSARDWTYNDYWDNVNALMQATTM